MRSARSAIICMSRSIQSKKRGKTQPFPTSWKILCAKYWWAHKICNNRSSSMIYVQGAAYLVPLKPSGNFQDPPHQERADEE
jgi:hypothetical protein